MENETIKFIDDNGQEKEAVIINVIEVNNQEYLLYSIEENAEEDNLFAMKIIKKEDGEEDLLPITDPKEKDELTNTINRVLDNIE